MDLGLAGKRALVCGASGGIGLACARALAEEGVEVHLVARDSSRLEAAVSTILEAGGIGSSSAEDLRDPEAPQRIVAAFPAADIVVTNPGASPAADLLTGGEAAWHDGIEAIVSQPLALIALALPPMKAQGFGRIINVTSAAFAHSSPRLAFSGALRGALTHAMTSLARQVAAEGITVNNIAPGPVESAGLHHHLDRIALAEGITREQAAAGRLASVPTGRFATADEIGRICAFLASVHTANITGRTILADGGANPYPFL